MTGVSLVFYPSIIFPGSGMVGQSKTATVVLALFAAACAGEATVTPTTSRVAPPTSTAFSITSTVPETTITTETGPVVVGEFAAGVGTGTHQKLSARTTYSMAFPDGFTLEVTPPMEHWILVGFAQSRAVLGWNGPTGFDDGALEVVVYDVGVDGVDAAWSRIEGLRERFSRDVDWEWNWVDTGTGLLGETEAEWREVRFPPVPADDPAPNNLRLMPLLDSPYPTWLGHDSSARFYVVPVDDLATVTVLVWESRCKCAEGLLGRPDHVDRDVENELSMWIAELEAFLASWSFESS